MSPSWARRDQESRRSCTSWVCLDVPTEGTYRLAGENVSDMAEISLASVRNRRIGFIFQQFNHAACADRWRNVEMAP